MTSRTLPSLLLVLGLSAAFAACGGSTDDATGANAGGANGQGAGGTSATGSPLPCDVDALVKARCQTCHGAKPAFGAPMALVTVEDFKKASSVAGETFGQRAIARLNDAAKPMPQPPNPPATDAEKAAFTSWVGAGMPSGPASCGAGGSAGAGGSGTAGSGTAGSGVAGSSSTNCVPDLAIVPSADWEMPQNTDDQYVCFGVDIPPGGDDKHITAIYPELDNTTIVHHILLYSGDKSYGPSTPKTCPSTPPVNWKLYYAWGPGTPPAVLPEEAGFRLSGSKGGHFMVQTHYSNLQHLAGQKDKTGMKACTGPLRKYDADVMAFGSTQFTLPAHTQKDVDCTSKASIVPNPTAKEFTVFQQWPHMHLLGRHMKSELVHADGTTEMLHDQPYDFNNQITYPANFVLKKTDTVRTVCTFDNMTSNNVSFGEDTSSEMCFNFFSYYPAATGGTWSWIAPAGLASCK